MCKSMIRYVIIDIDSRIFVYSWTDSSHIDTGYRGRSRSTCYLWTKGSTFQRQCLPNYQPWALAKLYASGWGQSGASLEWETWPIYWQFICSQPLFGGSLSRKETWTSCKSKGAAAGSSEIDWKPSQRKLNFASMCGHVGRLKSNWKRVRLKVERNEYL